MSDVRPIDYFLSSHPLRRFASEISLRARQKMFASFMTAMSPGPDTTIVDVGVTPDQSHAESNFFEALYPYKSRITATSIEDASFLEVKYPGLRFVRTSGSSLPFEDKSFDIVVCFAVLEHVGDREQQERFVGELLRIGRRLFLTTPNRQFPVEFHTFLPLIHWLPKRRHQAVLRRLGLEFWAQTENLNLLTTRDLRALFPDESGARFTGHKLLGLTSNLITIR